MFITVLALAVVFVNSVAPCIHTRRMVGLVADDNLNKFNVPKHADNADIRMKEQPMVALSEETVKANEQN